MKLLFITGLYPHEHMEIIRTQSYGCIQNAPNVFQWAVVEGLQNNKLEYKVLSFPFLPSYPFKYSGLFTPAGDIKLDDCTIGKMVSFCDLIVFKTLSIRRHCEKEIIRWIEDNKGSNDKLVILTYTPYPPFLKAIKSVKKKYPNIIVSSIITDLVDNIFDFKSNRSILKRIQCYKERYETKSLYEIIDKFILLTQPMIEKIPEAVDKYIVVEGISTYKERIEIQKENKFFDILYTGTLEKFSGIEQLVEGFMKLDNHHKVRLIICGTGYLSGKIRELGKIDSRIVFRGLLTREQVIELQKKATLLINPRRPDDEITKYSFPSKTMEYLSSGTPMIGYKLKGIPSEYYNYYYTIEDSSDDTLVKTLEYVLSLPSSELKSKADMAFDFVMNNKTANIQVKKIIDFISK